MYCPKCGTPADDKQNFCKKCGNQLSATVSQNFDLSNQVPHSSQAQREMDSANSLQRQTRPTYAGFWHRFFAYVVDNLIVTMSVVLVPFALGKIGGPLFLPLALIGGWLYYAFLESSKYQATLGKMASNIKVTGLRGERIGFGQASGRFFGKFVSGLTLGIGYLMAAFTAKRQALHDKMASTLVVRTSLSASEVAAAGPATPVGAFAITLVIIAGVLFGPFGIGILAAIAIPAYQDYTIRAKVSDQRGDSERSRSVHDHDRQFEFGTRNSAALRKQDRCGLRGYRH